MRRLFVYSTAATLMAVCGGLWAGEVEDKALAILEKSKDTVVTVELVLKQKFSMEGMDTQENEEKLEATGTVIDAQGLTVLALSSTDPSSLYASMMDMEPGFKVDSEVSDAKILLGNGKEVPAQIVLRDVDLDLAFLRPLTKPEAPFAFVDLNAAVQAKLLDQLVTLNRLGKVANRVYSVSLERIEAIVDKPRMFYIPGNDPTHTAQGSPAFALDGNIVGIFVIRVIKSTGGGGMMGGDSNMASILLPAADIAEGAKQAPGFDGK
ncbi:MAG: trypsin-like peptidase domain-containing protein [Candidatus Hydrogenedentes bacterium]|nr:trypsin-like peptidase domain-containing protein [Candidatus Hydrogenedentota bacterium]